MLLSTINIRDILSATAGDSRYTTAMERDELLTVKEVADRLKVHANTVRRWLDGQELHGIRLSGKAGWRVRESELERFLKERES